MDKYSFLNAIHSEQIEKLYQKYLKNPDNIEPNLRSFFQGFDFSQEMYTGNNSYYNESFFSEKLTKEIKVFNLVNSYITRGHLFTKTNPIRKRREYTPTLDLYNFDLSELDLDTIFDVSRIIGLPKLPLKKILTHLNKIYCDSIGVEYNHINDPYKIHWIQKWINKNDNRSIFSKNKKIDILVQLSKAVLFENFLHKKFVGQKRFSIEGNESLLPAINELIEYAVSSYAVDEFIIGMPHRGRINILSNILEKPYYEIFNEFNNKNEFFNVNSIFTGDVKYHLGYTNKKFISNSNKLVTISIVPNPSHLETVDAIVQGITRAKIDNYYNGNNKKIIPILIHGDAAIAAQGIVYEVLQMSELNGYTTGGTIHIVVNNQIGFTTDYLDARSSIYCTDIAKILDSPILHVNADDVEAVIHTIFFAVDFRMRYNKDVFIDLLGYRKYGHNEGDEPRFTQPLLYNIISKHPNVKDIYKKKLEEEGIIDSIFIDKKEIIYKKELEEYYKNINSYDFKNTKTFLPSENIFITNKNEEKILKKIDTRFSIEKLLKIIKVITTPPIGKTFYKKTKKLLEYRYNMAYNMNYIDWGMAELIAYGSLIHEGYNIRLSGEDVGRGTFSHRHAIIKSDNEEEFILLNNIYSENKGKIYIYNSLLSEYGVLGFDYGYAMSAINTLTIWEAQFGDFSNAAQIIIDQYISSAEDKWNIQNGLVMLLPHGYEGQGAEHSSARIERYLQLCANYNMFIANCTTPSNFYHILRRQIKFRVRKPLILFTPKSLLRHPKCISNIHELAEGEFKEVIDDYINNPKLIKKLVFCSGKIYYEILDKKEKINDKETAIIRIEQLYPLHKKAIINIIKKYYNTKRIIWVQEEPENMGAWSHILRSFNNISWELISPKKSATTAPGSGQHFLYVQNKIIENVFQ